MKNLTHAKTAAIFLIFAILLAPATGLAGKSKYIFKIASLAPAGSIWAKHFDNFAKEVNEMSNGEITFKVYPGGVMGDDRAMYRKMQIGQLHGGGFTMTGISEVVPDFRVLGIPVMFKSLDEVDKVSQALLPTFRKAFEDKGLAFIAQSEVGFVYAMSATPVKDLDQLRKTKCWLPSNDPVNLTYFQNLGVTPIQLSIPDVLPSLQTGLIDTVFNSFYGSIVLQWFTKTAYITDAPYAYAYGALVFSKKSMDRLSPQYVEAIYKIADKHFAKLLAATRKSNDDALTALKDNGIKLIEPTPETLRELEANRVKTVEEIIGNAFSKKIYAEAMKVLGETRGTTLAKGN